MGPLISVALLRAELCWIQSNDSYVINWPTRPGFPFPSANLSLVIHSPDPLQERRWPKQRDVRNSWFPRHDPTTTLPPTLHPKTPHSGYLHWLSPAGMLPATASVHHFWDTRVLLSDRAPPAAEACRAGRMNTPIQTPSSMSDRSLDCSSQLPNIYVDDFKVGSAQLILKTELFVTCHKVCGCKMTSRWKENCLPKSVYLDTSLKSYQNERRVEEMWHFC